MKYPAFLRHNNTGTIVETATGMCVASAIERHKIGQVRPWNYPHAMHAWSKVEDPKIWVDAIGIQHKK